MSKLNYDWKVKLTAKNSKKIRAAVNEFLFGKKMVVVYAELMHDFKPLVRVGAQLRDAGINLQYNDVGGVRVRFNGQGSEVHFDILLQNAEPLSQISFSHKPSTKQEIGHQTTFEFSRDQLIVTELIGETNNQVIRCHCVFRVTN